MSVQTSLPSLIGDLRRFGPLQDRVEGLIEMQVTQYRPGASNWLVLPWSDGFYLFSEDGEGQRRGREIVMAFLGPAVVEIETVPDQRLDRDLPADWRSAGLTRASYLRRVDRSSRGAEGMLSRLEDMAVTFRGRVPSVLNIRPSHSDLLRDLRLALLNQDDEAARRLFDEIRIDGHLSAENLRFLRIEYLAAFGRWTEMRALPHLSALVRARRPRIVSETLLQMVWWTELVRHGHFRVKTAFRDRHVLDEFGPLLRSVRVPSTPEARLVCFLTALADDDPERQEALLRRTGSAEEEANLLALAADTSGDVAPETPTPDAGLAERDPVAQAFEAGRFLNVIKAFLDAPLAVYADLAVQAILESGVADHAALVLARVRELDRTGVLSLNRRARRDIEELERLANDACGGWNEWAGRLASTIRWADASAVLRDNAGSWESLRGLPAQQVTAIAEALLGAVGGVNDDQLRGSLDLLCKEAASFLSGGVANDFCQVVLALLSEQDNFSEMVRSAYLDLLLAWLQVGPGPAEYGEVIDQTLAIWARISSPFAVGWAIGVLEAATDSPCPDPQKRSSLAIRLIESARQFYPRLSIREKVEIESLAAQLGLPTQGVEAAGDEIDVWRRLDGKLVGIYSLLPRAASLLKSRLAQLCAAREVRGNNDEVATQALRSLAQRADYLIVDTWHAAHQATAAIDAVRPKEKQVLPRQRGISGFLKALEEALVA